MPALAVMAQNAYEADTQSLVMSGTGTRQHDQHIVRCWARRQGDADCGQAKMTLAVTIQAQLLGLCTAGANFFS